MSSVAAASGGMAAAHMDSSRRDPFRTSNHNHSHSLDISPADFSPGPPIIVNTRYHPTTPLSAIPLNERHPLERGQEEVDFVPGRGSKDKEEYERIYTQGAGGGVWRAEDHFDDEGDGYGEREEDAGPAWEMVEGAEIQVDLGQELLRSVPVRTQGGERGREGDGRSRSRSRGRGAEGEGRPGFL